MAAKEDQSRQQHGQRALENITNDDESRRSRSKRAQHIGGPGLAAAKGARVAVAEEPSGQHAEWDRAKQIARQSGPTETQDNLYRGHVVTLSYSAPIGACCDLTGETTVIGGEYRANLSIGESRQCVKMPSTLLFAYRVPNPCAMLRRLRYTLHYDVMWLVTQSPHAILSKTRCDKNVRLFPVEKSHDG